MYRLFSRSSKFLKYWVFCSKYLVFQIQGVKNLVFWNFWFKKPSISIEKFIRFLIEILGISIRILSILKICDNRIPYIHRYQVNMIYQTNLTSLQFFSNCSSSFSHLYCVKLIKCVISLYYLNHDANQSSEIWKKTSECLLKTEK